MAAVSPCEAIAGAYIVSPDIHGDERGVFVETYRREWIPGVREMIQANRGDRRSGSVVGLHYHLHQADYWYVPVGQARVVLHDLRSGSPTDGQTVALPLGTEPDGVNHHRGVYIPPGVAHGFAALSDMTITWLTATTTRPTSWGWRGTTRRSAPIGAWTAPSSRSATSRIPAGRKSPIT